MANGRFGCCPNSNDKYKDEILSQRVDHTSVIFSGQMFRAIIPGQLRRGSLSLSVPRHFTEKLIQQFSASAQCAEIFVDNSFQVSATNFPKVVPISNVNDYSRPDRLPNLVIGSCEVVSGLNRSIPNPSFVLLSPIFGSKDSGKMVEELSSRFPDSRISVFKHGRILCSDAAPSFLKGRSYLDLALDTSYPIHSQFLPARYREIEASHLAQAIRLNYETCEPSYSESLKNVEYLDFVDCMKIIGLEEKI